MQNRKQVDTGGALGASWPLQWSLSELSLESAPSCALDGHNIYHFNEFRIALLFSLWAPFVASRAASQASQPASQPASQWGHFTSRRPLLVHCNQQSLAPAPREAALQFAAAAPKRFTDTERKWLFEYSAAREAGSSQSWRRFRLPTRRLGWLINGKCCLVR